MESAQDVLEEMPGPTLRAITSNLIAHDSITTGACGEFDSSDSLLEALGYDPIGLDALQARTGLDTPTLQARLMELEIHGHVARLPGGLFQRCALA